METDPSSSSRILEDISSDVRAAIIKKLQHAYRDACDRFDPSIGCRNQNWGMDVYWFAVHRLKELANDFPEIVSVESEYPVFRLRIGSVRLGCHRVGDDETTPISEAYPNSHGAVELVAQMSFAFTEPTEGAEAPSTTPSIPLVLAHFGNPIDGMCSAYLAEPTDFDERTDRISAWGETEQIWIREDAEQRANRRVTPAVAATTASTSTRDQRPPPEEYDVGTVRLKVVKEEKEK